MMRHAFALTAAIVLVSVAAIGQARDPVAGVWEQVRRPQSSAFRATRSLSPGKNPQGQKTEAQYKRLRQGS
jgi:hypothetical protein